MSAPDRKRKSIDLDQEELRGIRDFSPEADLRRPLACRHFHRAPINARMLRAEGVAA